MVKIILYLCQFWTCATTLTSCCRQKIKSYCSYSATVYNSLQTRGHVTQRGLLLITAPGCLDTDTAARHGAGHKVAVIDRKRDLLSWSSYFPHLNRGVALSSRQDEWRGEEDQNTIHHHHILTLEAGTLRTEARLPINIYFVIINAAQLLHRSNY